MVELAKIMEMVLDVVKRHSSHSSETFWRDVGDLGAMLFGERRAKNDFLVADWLACSDSTLAAVPPALLCPLPTTCFFSAAKVLQHVDRLAFFPFPFLLIFYFFHDFPLFAWTVAVLASRLSIHSKQAHVSAFVMLAALCKMATGILRTLSDGELVARDLGNKVCKSSFSTIILSL